MFRLQNKKLLSKNEYKLFNEKLIFYYIITYLLLFITNDLVFKSLYVSVICASLYLIFNILIDQISYFKECKNQMSNKSFYLLIDNVLIMKNYYKKDELIINAFLENNKPIWENNDSTDQKIKAITKFYSSNKFDIFYKAIMCDANQNKIYKIINILKKENKNNSEFIKIYKEFKFYQLVSIICEIILILFHSFFNSLTNNIFGVCFYIIVIFLPLIFELFISIFHKKQKNKYFGEFKSYFECLCIIEKPFIAYDDFCLINDELAEKLSLMKEHVINNNQKMLIEFLKKNKKEQNLYVYIFESLKHNSLVKLDYQEYEDTNKYLYVIKNYILINILFFVSIFSIGVIYL